VVKPIDRLQVPTTVQALHAARIDRPSSVSDSGEWLIS
jgi:hypothetical protein